MRAMILAAGVGSRLDPLTRRVPKPMVPIVGKPVIEHLIDKLKKHGITEIWVNLHYLGSVIQDHLGDGSRYGVSLSYSQEEQLWGDAGSVKLAEEFLKGDTFLVIGGDDISDMDLSQVIAFHKKKKAVATLGLTLVDDPSEFGIVQLDDDGRITRFLEKPKGEVFSKTANTGIYILEPEVLDVIPAGTVFGFGNHVFPKLQAEGRPMYGFVSEAYWKDVGNLKVYRQTQFDAISGKVALDLPLTEVRPTVWQGEGVTIDPTAEIGAPVALGKGVHIGPGAKIWANSILGAGCMIEAGVTLQDTILWEGVTVKAGTHLERCIVGAGITVGADAAIFDGIIVNPERLHGK